MNQANNAPSQNPTFFDSREAAKYLGLKKCTLEAWRTRGGGPKFVKLGRIVRYRKFDLDNWIESRVRENTIQGVAA